jgi:hypothetical protein
MSQPNSSKESTRYQSLSDCFQNLLSQTNARQESSGQFKGTCPAHDDHKASLSLKLEDNQILLNCFAGCDFNNVCEKLGVDPKELFADPYQDDPPPRKSKTVAKYVYTNPDGSPRFVVIRKEDKRFSQARINPHGKREYSMKDVKRIPYRLPQLIEAIKARKTLLLVEGEKDVETAEKLGFIATTFPQGAGKCEVADECIEWLKDAEVVLIPDNDESGQSHMQMIGEKLLPVARSIRLLQLPDLGEKEDLSDWFQKGGTNEDLEKLVDESPLFTPSGSPESSPEQFFTLIGQIPLTEPEWLIEGVLECGALGMIFGQSESGKSYFALDFGARIATGKAWQGKEVSQGTVLYMAAEGRPGLKRRQRAWEQVNEIEFGDTVPLYLSADAADLSNEEVVEKLRRDIRSIPEPEQLRLVIIDTLHRHNSGDENSTHDMGNFLSHLGRIQKEFKVAVLLIHHSGVGKETQNRGRGSSSLRAALDTEIKIENNEGTIDFTNTKQKDFERFAPMSFQLKQVNLQDAQGRKLADRYGDPITSCVLEQIGYVQPEEDKSNPKGKNQRVFIRCFEDLLKRSPEEDRVSTEVLKEMVRKELNVKSFSSVWRDLQRLDPKFFSIGDDVTIRVRQIP